MTGIKVGVPLHGKMVARAFHQPFFRDRLLENGINPVYFLSPTYFRSFEFDPEKYFELQVDQYDAQYQKYFLLQQLRLLRRFVVVTDTTDLRFREAIESKLFDATFIGMATQMSYVSLIRRIPQIGKLLAWLERSLYETHVHDKVIVEQGLQCVLTPGMGNYGYWNEGNFALEAHRLNLPVFAAITNYDNIVNMGYRNFTPTYLAVWSKLMADELVKLHAFPAKKIEITGPVHYDRLLKPLPMNHNDFIRSMDLDPKKKTILFAGGVNINHYYEIYRLFVENKSRIWNGDFNFIVRPQPHAKLLASPGWQVLEKLFTQAGVYVSNPGSVDATSDRTKELSIDLGISDGPDELNCLLRYCDLLINNFSTIGLEAAICDLPVIHIGYDAYTFGVRFGVTTGFQQRMTHNRRKLRLAASKVAKSEIELLSYIEYYLSDKNHDSEARREYAVSECGELDGQSALRLVKLIKSHI